MNSITTYTPPPQGSSMIFRRACYPQESYTTIPNRLLRGTAGASEVRSDGLSPESLGVLAYLLSHKTEWRVTNRQLQKVFGVGDSKITRITRELMCAGYIRRSEQTAQSNWDWDVRITIRKKNNHGRKTYLLLPLNRLVNRFGKTGGSIRLLKTLGVNQRLRC